MRKLFGLCLALLGVALLTSYGLWTQQRPIGHYLSDLRISLALNEGQPAGRGNLLGIEARLYPTDYQDLERLHRKLAAWLQQARDLGLVNDKTVVVLPEHIGTWLFASGEKPQFYQAGSVEAAMDWLAWSNPVAFLYAMLQAEGDQRPRDARMRMKARAMARDYQQLFGGLAREFGVTLVAGSIVLPEPRLEDGRLTIGSGPLFNISLVFGPDGKPLGQPQRQLHPAPPVRGYVQAAEPSGLQVFDTAAGRLGVLIGRDSWYPASYTLLNAGGAELIAVPAFIAGNRRWNEAWQPREGLDLPSAGLSEGQAWQRLSLTGQPPHSTARAGISVFMQGQFWNQGSSGNSFIHHPGSSLAEQPGSPLAEKSADGARLINLWL